MINLPSKVFRLLPESSFKNKIRCWIYNQRKHLFRMSYSNNVFHVKYSSFDLKFRTNPYHLLIEQQQYNEIYKLKKGDIVIDAGAFMGTFCLYASKILGDKGHVFAFEPDDKNWLSLLENIKLNKPNNVTPIKKGLWKSDTSLHFSNDGSLGSRITSSKNSRELIESVSIDSFVSNNGIKKVDFVKMDIEGAEIEAIEGAQSLLSLGTTFSIASYHMVNGVQTYKSLENTFKKSNYEVKTLKVPEIITHAAYRRQ